MNKRDLYDYTPEKEEAGGVYYQFLNLSKEEIESMDVNIVNFSKIVTIVKNDMLRDILKAKFYELVRDESIHTIADLMERGQYNENERNSAFKIKLEEILENNIEDIEDFENFVSKISYVSDKEWKDKFIKKVAKRTEAWFEEKSKEYNYSENFKNYRRLRIIKGCNNIENAEKFYEIWEHGFSEYDKAIAQIFMNNHYISDKAKTYSEDEVLIGVDPDIEIGTEIELNNINDRAVDIVSNQEGFDKWESKIDVTVPGGNEFISPVLNDTYEDMSSLKALFESLKEVGYYVDKNDGITRNTSSQVNIGLEYLDSPESLLCFFELYGNVEDVLYHICNPNGELIRQDVSSSSRFKSVASVLGTKVIPEDITRDEVIDMFASDRDGGSNRKMKHKKMSVCIRDGKSKYGAARLEFRMSNGSDDFDVWRQNIKLYAKLVEAAKSITNIRKKDDISAKEELKLLQFEQLKDEENTLEDKLDILMDILFDDDSDKQIYQKRYDDLKETLKTRSSYRYTNEQGKEKFDNTDFQRIYKPKNWSLEYDPETDKFIESEDDFER